MDAVMSAGRTLRALTTAPAIRYFLRDRRLLSFGGGLVTRSMGVLGSSFLSILVARISGTGGLGRFSVFVSLLGFGAIFGRRGLDMIVMREVAHNELSGDQGNRIALLYRAIKLALPTLLIVAVAGAALLASGVLGAPMNGAVVAFLFCLPMLGALMIVSGYMKGASLNWLSPLFEIGGISLVACALMGALLLSGLKIDEAGAPIVLGVAMLLSSLVATVLVLRDARVSTTPLTARVYNAFNTGHVAFIIIMLASFMAQSGSILIVAPFLSPEQLGLVRAADRLALIVSFPALAIRPYIAPRIVGHFHRRSAAGIWRLMAKSAIAGIAISAIPLAALLLFPGQVLQLFGHGFTGAAGYLRVLAVAQLLILLFSPFSMVLNMGGGETKDMWISLTILIPSIVAFPVVTVAFGATGFVAAYSGVTIVRAGLTVCWAYRLIKHRCRTTI